MTNMAMRLEQLPNEIFLQIFGYVRVKDLHGFFNQNQRMNDIIHGMKLNVIVEEPVYEDEDWDCLKIFHPEQFIRLELRANWNEFHLNAFQELRSLSLDSCYLSENQFDQLLTVRLPYLERLSIDEVPHFYAKQLFQTLIDNEHFPSLKVCRFSGQYPYRLFDKSDCQAPNTTICSLILSRCSSLQCDQILTLLPNLRRLEMDIHEPQFDARNLHLERHSLEYLRITIEDPLRDLQTILPHVPHLKRLRIKGRITEDTVIEYFKVLSHLVQSVVPNLQVFDCELYFHAFDPQIPINVIQQLHPLFKDIECRLGSGINQCYTTDLDEYPHFSEYSHVPRQADNWFSTAVMNGYDSDPYDDYNNDPYDDNDNGWIDYGLGYRGNYKANYGSSPWSGNNDD